MEKKINLSAVSFLLDILMRKTYAELQEKFDEWPEDPDGVLITVDQVKEGLEDIEAYGMSIIEDLVGELPEVEDPVTDPDRPEPIISTDPDDYEYETKFHHTSTGLGSDERGKALVLCAGQRIRFDKVVCNGVVLPRQRNDDMGRETYWNMFSTPKGDILCKKGDKMYKYPADEKIVYGSCE